MQQLSNQTVDHERYLACHYDSPFLLGDNVAKIELDGAVFIKEPTPTLSSISEYVVIKPSCIVD